MISQTAEYALRATVCLARDVDSRMTRPEIAALTGLPPGYLSKVMQELAKAGVVDSQRGCSGGFKLARPPDEISLLEIVNAVDPLARHLKQPRATRVADEFAALDRRLNEVLRSLECHLERIKLDDLLRPPDSPPPGPERGPLC